MVILKNQCYVRMVWYDHSSYAFKKKLSKEERYFKISWKYQPTSPPGCLAGFPVGKNENDAELHTTVQSGIEYHPTEVLFI